MADATLLPCPFCGAQPKSQKASDKIHPYRITCCGCGCMTANHGDYRNAWDAWNTRQPQLPSDDGLIKALEETISAWAFAHNIDGAARNDLFVRIRATLTALQVTAQSNKVSKP